MGKTALVCRVLKAVENGHLSDNGGPCSVDGIFYLTANGLRRVSFPHLYEDLLSLVPAPTAQDLEARYKDPHLSTAAKLRALLAAFPHGRVVVLLDNFEDVVGAETQEIRDGEMDEALHTVLTAPHYGVKIILTTRIAPRDFVTLEAGRQMRRDLDSGLESPYAENILREMDSDGTVGLKTAPDTLLAEARARTQGYPRALEALFGILAADRYTTLPELLSDPTALLPQDVVTSLVGEAFNRLDAPAQRVMQALAIYGRPVAAVAVDYLLQPYLPGVNSTPILHRLVNMHFVRRDKGYFSLHPVDRSYALARVPQGQEADRYDLFEDEPPFTRYALLDRAADYFTEIRKPREAWKTIHDLDPQLAEFELRCEGEDYDSAALVLLDIDYEYLLLWGHYRLMIALHERLQGKLGDGELQQNSVGNLGTAHWRIGEITHAITCYQQALTLAREQQDRGAEAAWLGNLGNCLFSLILTFSRREKESSAYRQVCQFLLTLISFDHCLTSSLDK